MLMLNTILKVLANVIKKERKTTMECDIMWKMRIKTATVLVRLWGYGKNKTNY